MSGAVVAYTRVSTLGQDTGLEIQREKIQGWAKFQGLKLEPELVFEDRLSGANDDRPGLKAALRGVLQAAAADKRGKEREAPVLVVYKLDRLGRNAVDVQEALAVLLDADVRVVALADGVDSTSGMGAALLKLLVSILSTFAELERETIRLRLLAGRERANGANRPYASEPAYGRRLVDGVLLEHAGEVRAAARARELRDAGKSYGEIAKTMLDEDLRPRRAATWSKAVLHRLVTGVRAARPKKKATRIARARAELLGPG